MNNDNVPNFPKKNKKFLGVHFKCCNIYNRVYINDNKTAYEGQCPCCRKKVFIAIGKGGTASRFFEVS